MSGIHLHPHDILDEGASTALSFIRKIGGIRYLLPEANTIFERNPYPNGRLPHNPVRPFVQGTGTWHLQPAMRELSPRLYQVTDESVSAGADSLSALLEATRGSDYKVVPWVNLLNGHFEGELEANGVIDFRGSRAEHWLCPNGPDVVDMWTNVLLAVSERYGCTTFLLDRLRFPDWAGKKVNPAGLFSCFCSRCQEGMSRQGLQPERVREELETIAALLGEKQFGEAVARLTHTDRIQSWMVFKRRSVTSMIGKLMDSLRRHNPSIVCWLDLWPPAYAWILGQDYTELSRHTPALKHFPYHKLGGGADVQGLINHLADGDVEQEQAFQAFMRLFGMSYPITYAQFKRDGFPIEFVTEENDKARALTQPGTYLFSGIQMWNLPPEQLVEAIEAARHSAADDMLYYCYGWAAEELFVAAGELDK